MKTRKIARACLDRVSAPREAPRQALAPWFYVEGDKNRSKTKPNPKIEQTKKRQSDIEKEMEERKEKGKKRKKTESNQTLRRCRPSVNGRTKCVLLRTAMGFTRVRRHVMFMVGAALQYSK